MPLVTLKEVLDDADKKGIAIGAFNIGNYESCKAIIDTAEELGLPVIVQVFNRLFNDNKARELSFLVKGMAVDAGIPVVLHLDHGKTIEQVEKAISYGFTSVMIDGSELPFKENVKLTQKVVSIAHKKGISVEAELGHVLPKDGVDISNFLTVPEEAKEFAEKTSIDALAVAIGTAHGHYAETPVLDLERLKRIHSLTDVPLVLHGGSDTPIKEVQKSISYGVRKINIATELHQVFLDELQIQTKLHREKFSPIDVYMHPVYEMMKGLVKEKMKFFTSQIH